MDRKRTDSRVVSLRSAQELRFSARRSLDREAKTAIARTAAGLVHDGMIIGLTAGTTTWAVAKQLRGATGLSFLTNSLNVAVALEDGGWDSILLAGGRFRTPSDALVGSFAEDTLRQFHTDLLFVGAHGVDERAGLTTPNLAEAAVNRVLVANARRVVAVIDASKLGTVSLASFASLEDVDVLVTDSRADPATVARLGAKVARIVLADSSKEVPRT